MYERRCTDINTNIVFNKQSNRWPHSVCQRADECEMFVDDKYDINKMIAMASEL